MAKQELDEIRRRNADACRRRLGLDYQDALQAHLHDIPALIAEVDRLNNRVVRAQESWNDTREQLASVTAERDALKERTRWIPVSERLPESETEVFILAETSTGHKVITTAMYEDGKMPTGDSVWNWYDIDFDYDEENDEYLIPKGWWEYRHYNSDEVYNNTIDDVVTHWMPLPEAPKEADRADS